jgi:RNA polymerase sigma factor (sigma-70 family)
MRLAPRVAAKAGLPADVADDLAQDACHRALRSDWAALQAASPGVALDAWLAGCLRHAAHEAGRRDARSSAAMAAAEVSAVDADDRPTDDRLTDGADGLEDVRRLAERMTPVLWAALTPAQAAAVRLAADGCGTPGIARELGVSRAAVRDRLRRAVARLQRVLRGAPPIPPRRPVDVSALGWRGHPLTARQAQAVALWNDGATLAAIGRALACAPEVTRSLIRRLRERARNVANGAACAGAVTARPATDDPTGPTPNAPVT